jgi:hypothetical protein
MRQPPDRRYGIFSCDQSLQDWQTERRMAVSQVRRNRTRNTPSKNLVRMGIFLISCSKRRLATISKMIGVNKTVAPS